MYFNSYVIACKFFCFLLYTRLTFYSQWNVQSLIFSNDCLKLTSEIYFRVKLFTMIRHMFALGCSLLGSYSHICCQKTQTSVSFASTHGEEYDVATKCFNTPPLIEEFLYREHFHQMQGLKLGRGNPISILHIFIW